MTDPSVFVRFPLTSGPLAGQAALLIWTTTPWTLVSNTAVAVRPDVTYVVATDGAETLVVAEPLLDMCWVTAGGSSDVPGRRDGAVDVRAAVPPRRLRRRPAHFVVLADYVTTDDGTGLVHQSPAFGAPDLEVGPAYGLPVVNPVQHNGHFADDVPLVGGQFFKHADSDLVDELAAHRPCCSATSPSSTPTRTAGGATRRSCTTPLPAWYIRTTAVKDAAAGGERADQWFPETVKWGRYGDWLRNNVDWSLSRTRYWGTPLPIWRCGAGHLTCVGSLAELGALAGEDARRPRPAPALRRRRGRRLSRRLLEQRCATPLDGCSEVIDAWYDSGSMPFAQWGFPYVEGSREQFDGAFPAQYICEALDQTRGWFYSLMAIGTLLFDRSDVRERVCLGLLLAEDGRKMSKHLGNILEPMPLMEQHGADAVRWFMAGSGSPWSARRVGDAAHAGDRPQGAADLLEHGRVPGAVRPGSPAGHRPTARLRRVSGRCSTAGWSQRRIAWSAT